MHNPDVAEIFETAADLLETEGEGRYKIEAYLDAAHLCRRALALGDFGARLT